MARNLHTANTEIRERMRELGISQHILAERMGISHGRLNKMLQQELTPSDDTWVRSFLHVKADETDNPAQELSDDTLDELPIFINAKYQIGDEVKISGSAEATGKIVDILRSSVKQTVMYAVKTADGTSALYAEDQLEPAPDPVSYDFKVVIEDNVAVATMIATQGEKTWVFARGHAHIMHDGEAGLAQAVSYATKRMFKAVDEKQEKPIYFRNKEGSRNDKRKGQPS